MSTWDGNNFYYSGQGVVLLGGRTAGGAAMNLRPVGNVSNLAIQIETSVLEHKESQTGNRGIDLRLTTQTKCKLTMTMENFIAANLAESLRGTSTPVVAGINVAGIISGGAAGTVSSLGRVGLTSASITDTPALTLGVDYLFNLDAGSVKWLTDQSTNVVIATTISYPAQFVVDPLVLGFTELYMRFEGLNTADGNKPVVIDIFKFSTDPLKELSMISDTVQQFQLEGNVLADPLQITGSKFFKVQMLR